MQVNETLNKIPNIINVSEKEEKKTFDTKETAFQSQLRHVEGQSSEERIRALAEKITQQGEVLGKKVDIRELKIYKKLISEFLDEAVNTSSKFSKESYLDRRGRYKVFATVKKVNAGLEELTKEVLNDQKDNIKILKSLDDIRGLIMDLTL